MTVLVTGFFWGVMKMFWSYIVAMVAQHCECTGSHRIVHFKIVKMVNFMLCEFYFNLFLKLRIKVTKS